MKSHNMTKYQRVELDDDAMSDSGESSIPFPHPSDDTIDEDDTFPTIPHTKNVVSTRRDSAMRRRGSDVSNPDNMSPPSMIRDSRKFMFRRRGSDLSECSIPENHVFEAPTLNLGRTLKRRGSNASNTSNNASGSSSPMRISVEFCIGR